MLHLSKPKQTPNINTTQTNTTEEDTQKTTVSETLWNCFCILQKHLIQPGHMKAVLSFVRIQAFFFSECCMAQRKSLSGRSPFCQRKQSEESQIHWKSFSLKATITKPKTQKHQPRCSLPESAGGYRCSLFLGQLDQGLVGYAESTHVNRPKGKALLASWVGRCCRL